jgi:hypothetical protein
MISHLRRLVRRFGRVLRPVLVLALVAAQCVTAFGYPLVVRSGETVRRCGCKVRGPSEQCCCGPRACCGGVAGQPIPEPDEPSCPKCKLKKSAPIPVARTSSTTLKWLPSVTARSCHGESSFGFATEFPSIPPAIPATQIAEPPLTDSIPLDNDRHDSPLPIPPDHPPRRG